MPLIPSFFMIAVLELTTLKYDCSSARGTNMIDLMIVSICLSEVASDVLMRMARSFQVQTSFKGIFKSRTIVFRFFGKGRKYKSRRYKIQ
ncbi:hypothetical protein EDC94DRAFT_606150 [Helicostylum pulchrum]|nr:hypothetical protein EDC94DRAFT_606150 [Helicostylum pulchrum]